MQLVADAGNADQVLNCNVQLDDSECELLSQRCKFKKKILSKSKIFTLKKYCIEWKKHMSQQQRGNYYFIIP